LLERRNTPICNQLSISDVPHAPFNARRVRRENTRPCVCVSIPSCRLFNFPVAKTLHQKNQTGGRMPGKPPMPAPNCVNPVTWSGSEKVTEDDLNNALGAFTAAYKAAQKLANAEMNKFEAQACPQGCTFQSDVRDDEVITVQPILKKAVKGKGLAWVCDLEWKWSDTIYCYPNAKAKKDADEARDKEKREKARKAKEGG
jgi:hypothetical protein